MSFYYGSTIVLLIWEKRIIQVRALKEDLNFSSRQKQQHTQIVHGLFTRAFCHRPIKLSSTLVVVVFILQLNCNVSVNAPTVFRLSGILELLSCALSLQLCIALRFQFFRNFFILPLVFFKPVNTSRGPRPGCCRRCSVYLCGCCVQDSFVGPGMHSLAVKSTAWLWLIVLRWGFHPTRLPYYNKKGDKKNVPSSDIVHSPVQVMTLHETWMSQVFILHGCCSQRVTPWRIHMITSTQWNETYWNVTQTTLDISPGSTLA